MSTAGGVRDRVVAWAIDPRRVLVAWDVAPATRIRVLRRLGARARHARPAVRIVSERAEAPVDVAADAGTHVLVASPVGEWVAEIGFRLADGGFVPMARSSPTGTKRAATPAAPVTWVRATRPTVPITHPWGGQGVPPALEEHGGAGASDASVG